MAPTLFAHPDTIAHNVNVLFARVHQAIPEMLCHLASEVNVNLTMNVVIIVLASTTRAPIHVLENVEPMQFVKPKAISPFAPVQVAHLEMRSSHAVNQELSQLPDTTVH